MHKILSLLIATIIFFGPGLYTAAAEDGTKLLLFYSNDVQGEIEPCG
ncbi:MAG: hypothetical protein KAI75_08125 [Desulfobulbaceae bacterium]|nr:hypothetical protein [Desulfobulbaceae bacterium]